MTKPPGRQARRKAKRLCLYILSYLVFIYVIFFFLLFCRIRRSQIGKKILNYIVQMNGRKLLRIAFLDQYFQAFLIRCDITYRFKYASHASLPGIRINRNTVRASNCFAVIKPLFKESVRDIFYHIIMCQIHFIFPSNTNKENFFEKKRSIKSLHDLVILFPQKVSLF